MAPSALLRLLQLASPALPVGAYTYSQGLEWAVETGVVTDEPSAGIWIGDLMTDNVGRFEAPMLSRLMTAWQLADLASLARLNEDFLASRETAELRAETLQMGYSLRRLLHELGDLPNELLAYLDERAEVSFPLVWAGVANAWAIPPGEAVAAYLWGWAENQVMAALKAVPLGQAAGQRLLRALGDCIPALAESALTLTEGDMTNFAPAFAIAAACHETQYSRLFRS